MKKIYTILFLIFTVISFNLKAETVIMETSKGSITIELDSEKAPITVKNFLQYANDGFYDGLIFHRVIKGFMIQTGGFTFDFSPRDAGRDAIVNESGNGLKNNRGTLAMARTADPDSAKAQFFINHKSNGSLNAKGNNPGYAVFGAVVSGMRVVDAIAVVNTQTMGPYGDVPVKPIRILSARLANPESWTALPEPTPAATIEKPVPLQ